MKLLKHFLGGNSICWGDEVCDRMEQEERRMKGWEEKSGRFAAQGLIDHYDPTLSFLPFSSSCTFKVKM